MYNKNIKIYNLISRGNELLNTHKSIKSEYNFLNKINLTVLKFRPVHQKRLKNMDREALNWEKEIAPHNQQRVCI